MNQGIRLLMARMDTHPAEFEIAFGPDGSPKVPNRLHPQHERWRWAIRLLVEREPPPGLLTVEEVRLLRKKYWALQDTAFSNHVMSCLIDGTDS